MGSYVKNEEGNYIEFKLNNYLFNAGLLGFYNIIEFNNEKANLVKIYGNKIKVPVTIFENFEKDFINYFIDKYEKEMMYTTIIDRINKIKISAVGEENSVEDIKKEIKYINSKLLRGSYKSGYAIIKDSENDIFSVESEIKKINSLIKNKNFDLKNINKIFNQIEEYLKKHKNILCMKDISYSIITTYWSNYSFLLKTAVKNDIGIEYNQKFVKKILKYDKKENFSKLKKTCIECGNSINDELGHPMSWLNEIGVDNSRKKSHYWNFKPDGVLCPFCALIYSCVPAGFINVNRTGIFINNSESFEALKKINDDRILEYNKISDLEKNMYYRIANKLEDKENEIKSTNLIQNIQVIKKTRIDKDNIKSQFILLDNNMLKLFKMCNKEFNYLTNKFVKINDLLIKLIKLSIVDGKRVNTEMLNSILNVQVIKEVIGGKKMDSKKVYIMSKKGLELRYTMKSKTDNYESKLRSFAYKLLNALKTKNINNFMDMIMRMYISVNKEVPTLFLESIQDEDVFAAYGYAYLIGLNGETYKGGNENE